MRSFVHFFFSRAESGRFFLLFYFLLPFLAQPLSILLHDDIYPPLQIFLTSFLSISIKKFATLLGIYIGTQIAALTVIAISVGIVTIILERTNSDTFVSLYYYETAAQGIVVGSLTLAAAMVLQTAIPFSELLFLPAGTPPNEYYHGILAALYCIVLVVNIIGLVWFILVSFDFTVGLRRQRIWRRITERRLFRSLQTNRHKSNSLSSLIEAELRHPPGGDDENAITATQLQFGRDHVHLEISRNFEHECELVEVWRRPLKWAFRSWANRSSRIMEGKEEEITSPRRPRLVFPIDFESPLLGETPICFSRDGVHLNWIERHLIRCSFKFRRIRIQ